MQNYAIAVLILAIVVVAIFAIAKKFKTHYEESGSKEEFIGFLFTEARDKLLPIITELALGEDINDGVYPDYASFKTKCLNDFTTYIYNLIMCKEDNFEIPSYLEPFITEENVKMVLESILDMREVDDLLHNTYLALVDKRCREIEAEEEKIAARNAEIGVEDETTLEKEDLGLVEKDSDSETDMTNIEAELVSAVDENELIEPIGNPIEVESEN